MSETVVRLGFDRARWESLEPGNAVQGGRWLSVMLSRLPGTPLTVTHEGLHGCVGFVGAIVEDSAAYEAYNPWMILRAPEPVFAEAYRNGRPADGLGDGQEDFLPSAVLVVPGYLGDPIGSGAAHPEEVLACLSRVCDWAWSTGLATVALLYTTPRATTVLEPAVASLGGQSFDLTARFIRTVTWSGEAAFWTAIGGRRRWEVRRQFRELQRQHCSVGEVNPADVFDEVVGARCELLRWYGQVADEYGEANRLRSLVDTFGDDVRLWATRRGDELVACALFIAFGRTLYSVWGGTTKVGRETRFAHLAAAYHGPMRDTSTVEFDVIDYGIGHEDTKRLQGCAAIPLRGHVISSPGATTSTRRPQEGR